MSIDSPQGDRTGDHAFADTVEGHPHDADHGMGSMPVRARVVLVGVFSVVSALLFGVGSLGLVPGEAAWPSAVTWGVRALCALAAVALVVLTIRANSGRGNDTLGRVSHVLLGVGWVLFAFTLVTDLVLRLPLLVAGVPNPMRSRVVSVILAVLVVGLAAYGHREAMRVPRLRSVDVPVSGLPEALDGHRVVVLTDTHFDAWTTRSWADGVVAAVNAVGADVVVHAGDLADGSLAQRGHQVAALAEVRAPHRLYIAGNHEYYSGADSWLGQMAEHGWQVLLNAHVVLGPGLVVAGVDDPTGTGRPGRGPDLDAALAGAPDGLPVVLLAHQPHLVRTSVGRVDLQISGHTHGGQMWPFHYLVRLREPVVQGLSRHGDRTHLYTSRGTGFWGPPFRVFAPSEISVLTLRRAG